MDDDQAHELVELDTPDTMARVQAILTSGAGLSSIDKVQGVGAELLAMPAQNEQQAILLSVVQMARGMGLDVSAYMPSDPAELDELLVKVAQLLLAARSDDAAHLYVAVRG